MINRSGANLKGKNTSQSAKRRERENAKRSQLDFFFSDAVTFFGRSSSRPRQESLGRRGGGGGGWRAKKSTLFSLFMSSVFPPRLKVSVWTLFIDAT